MCIKLPNPKTKDQHPPLLQGCMWKEIRKTHHALCAGHRPDQHWHSAAAFSVRALYTRKQDRRSRRGYAEYFPPDMRTEQWTAISLWAQRESSGLGLFVFPPGGLKTGEREGEGESQDWIQSAAPPLSAQTRLEKKEELQRHLLTW